MKELSEPNSAPQHLTGSALQIYRACDRNDNLAFSGTVVLHLRVFYFCCAVFCQPKGKFVTFSLGLGTV